MENNQLKHTDHFHSISDDDDQQTNCSSWPHNHLSRPNNHNYKFEHMHQTVYTSNKDKRFLLLQKQLIDWKIVQDIDEKKSKQALVPPDSLAISYVPT